MKLSGIWLPIITPFSHGKIDIASYETLLRFYLEKPIAGLIPLGTTGEAPTLDEHEMEILIDKTVSIVEKKLPIYVGLGGSATHKTLKLAKTLEGYPIDGFLAVCPYYNRPGQEGLRQHFTALSESTDKNIILYNIPYRTGVNLQNDTLFKLMDLKNIIGIKDCCAIMSQSLELLANKPSHFSVFTGEDALFYTMVANGADGGILASAHLNTDIFVNICTLLQNNQHQEALQTWKTIAPHIPLLFKESNPAPIKYCLWKKGLIQSQELRLPLLSITKNLEQELTRHYLS